MRRIGTTALLVGALLGGGLVAPTHAGNPDNGRLWAGDKVLKAGCHNYRYQYRVKPDTGEWSLETFLRDPTGQTIASNALDNFSDRKRGSGTFRLCRNVTRPGTFKIRGKLTTYDGYDQRVGWLKPSYFRMRKPS